MKSPWKKGVSRVIYEKMCVCVCELVCLRAPVSSAVNI